MNIAIKIIGLLLVLMPLVEIFTGVATEKTGVVRRDEKPVLFWFSIAWKLTIGLALLNIETLQARFGQ